MDNKSLENELEKIYNEIILTGKITDNQLSFLMLYEKKMNKPKKDTFEQFLTYGNKIVNIINKNLKER